MRLQRSLAAGGRGRAPRSARDSGYFKIAIHSFTSSGAHIVCDIRASGDPGYKATGVMLGGKADSVEFDRCTAGFRVATFPSWLGRARPAGRRSGRRWRQRRRGGGWRRCAAGRAARSAAGLDAAGLGDGAGELGGLLQRGGQVRLIAPLAQHHAQPARRLRDPRRRPRRLERHRDGRLHRGADSAAGLS